MFLGGVMEDSRTKEERVRDEALRFEIDRHAPEEIIPTNQARPREAWKAEDVLSEFVSRSPNAEATRKDVAIMRQQLEDAGAMSSVNGKRLAGMTERGFMRFAGSIPIDVWRADEVLHPYLSHQDRAKKILKEFPQFRVGNI
jgi:hypothetical protein